MMKSTTIAKGAFGAALAAMTLLGASALPSVAAAQDCSVPSTVGGLAGAGLGALVGANAGRSMSGCDCQQQAYYNNQPQYQQGYQQGYYAPPAPQAYYAPPPQTYYEPAPQPYYSPSYAYAPTYYDPGPAIVIAPGYYGGRGYYGGGRHYRGGRRW